MNILNNNFASIESMREQYMQQSPQKKTVSNEVNASSFERVLFEKQQSAEKTQSSTLKFSKHANERLTSRNIDLSKEQIQRLEQGTNKAREKGIQESLVMVDNLAFIVNISNNTVITAVNDTQDSVFTNIDGAVIS